MNQNNLESNDCIEIFKSFTDYKSYRIIKLPNEMKVVLISDIKPESSKLFSDIDEIKSTKKSACALCINVGCFNDPPELQGLAHYLEHMVFMGSSKYPMENDFDYSLSQHGGRNNASTSEDNTIFYFDSHFDYFESILDKFANFFINPLFTKECMDRELDIINSEYKYLCSDREERENHFLYQLTKENSLFRNFQCGSRKTLKEDPLLKNINVYKYIHHFRKKMYSSHKMTLAIQSEKSLDDLERIVKSIFSDIPKFQTLEVDKNLVTESFDTPEFNKLYFLTSLNDERILKLTWSLPLQTNSYQNAALLILCYLIDYKGPGSLYEYLSKLKYISSMQSNQILSSFHLMIQISVDMTVQGFDRFQLIIKIIFSFIQILKEGIPERIFNEYMKIHYDNFMYKENVEPLEMVKDMAKNLAFHTSKPVWSISYDSNICKEILNYITVNKMNVIVMSKVYESTSDKITNYYDMKYSVRNFFQEELTEWHHPNVISDLHMPNQSKFVAFNFDLLPIENNYVVPENLVTTKYKEFEKFGDLWYLSDRRFKIPKAIIRFNLLFHPRFKSVLNEILINFIIYSLKERLHEIQLAASIPGFFLSIDIQNLGIQIKIDGFNDKIPNLFTSIINNIRNLSLNERSFSIYKKGLLEYYQEHRITEKIKLLKPISLTQLLCFSHIFLKSMRIQSSFYGNVSVEQAICCFRYCSDQLGLESTESFMKIINESVPVDEKNIMKHRHISDGINTSVFVDYQIGLGTIKDQAYNRFLRQLIYYLSIHFLRTRETLGYFIDLNYSELNGSLGTFINVISESNKFTTDHLVNKMSEFFEKNTLRFLERLPLDEFKKFKSSFVSNCIFEDATMTDIECRNWKEITDGSYMFDRLFKHADYIRNITKFDLLEFFKDKYLNKFQRRKRNFPINAIKTETVVTGDLYSKDEETIPLKRSKMFEM